jgi:lycopene cyclase domain-containing protein
MSLYGWVILLSFIGPFALSFDKKVAFYKDWRFVIPAIIGAAIPFIIWDIQFTEWEIWGFTPRYLQGTYFYNLPIEEVLFFFVVPYNFLFILRVIQAYFPKREAPKFIGVITWVVILSGLLLQVIYHDNYYTFSATFFSAMLTAFLWKKHWFNDFIWAYLLCLIPFFIVNGILTGAFTPEPIVWYNSAHIIGFRMVSIPFEDLYYNFDLTILLTWIYFSLKKRKENLDRVL